MTHPRNPGAPLDPRLFAPVNRPATERRAASLVARRSLKGAHQAAWLVNAIACMDLTTLAGDDTEGRVARLCAKARRPLADEIVTGLGLDAMPQVGAVCVYPTMVSAALRALEGSGIPVASVATGFPAGLMPLDLRLAEIRYAVDQGAQEIDIVITRAHVLGGDWKALYDEVAAMREACGEAHLKAILATGDLVTLRNVFAASIVAMQAGADFIKTSTGKARAHASPQAVQVILETIRDSGQNVGCKVSGGIRGMDQAMTYLDLASRIMGREWLTPLHFRIGASGLHDELIAILTPNDRAPS